MSYELGYGDIAFFFRKNSIYSKYIALAAHSNELLPHPSHFYNLKRHGPTTKTAVHPNRFPTNINQSNQKIYHKF